MSKAIEVYDDRMYSLIHPNASLQKIAGGAVHSEGAVYFHEDDSVVWSDAHVHSSLPGRATQSISATGMIITLDSLGYSNGNPRSHRTNTGLIASVFVREPYLRNLISNLVCPGGWLLTVE